MQRLKVPISKSNEFSSGDDASSALEDEPSPTGSRRSSRLKSFAFVEGHEGKPITKDLYSGRSLGVFTSGGDAQGNDQNTTNK